LLGRSDALSGVQYSTVHTKYHALHHMANWMYWTLYCAVTIFQCRIPFSTVQHKHHAVHYMANWMYWSLYCAVHFQRSVSSSTVYHSVQYSTVQYAVQFTPSFPFCPFL
ncbi:unnamed protein product, partial [Discosporangium mesarthrocarpum]